MQVLQPFLQKIILLILFLSFAILFYKTKYFVQVMECKLQLKLNKNERGIWGFEFGRTEMCFPSLGLGL